MGESASTPQFRASHGPSSSSVASDASAALITAAGDVVPIRFAAAWNNLGETLALKCLVLGQSSRPMAAAIRSAAVPVAATPIVLTVARRRATLGRELLVTAIRIAFVLPIEHCGNTKCGDHARPICAGSCDAAECPALFVTLRFSWGIGQAQQNLE